MIVQGDANIRKGMQPVADLPSDDEIRTRLRNLSRHTGIPTLARAISGVGQRTVYNQLSDAPPPMLDRVRGALASFLGEVGMLEEPFDILAARRRVLELARIAEAAASALGDEEGDPNEGGRQ